MLFTFVVGDIGGARMQLPVAKELIKMGHNVQLIADGEGMGCTVFEAEKMDFWKSYPSNLDKLSVMVLLMDSCDLAFINTCASAFKVEKEFCFPGMIKKVAGADGYFNHGLPQWRNTEFDYWFAIDEGHARAIMSSRIECLKVNQVRTVGQPAFDGIIDLIPKKDEIRAQTRKELGIADNETAVIWWSQGMPEVIEEDVKMVRAAISYLKSIAKNPVLIPKIHPKLDKTVGEGTVGNIMSKVERCCAENYVRCIYNKTLSSEAVTLASDLILAITATEEIKSTMIGGPPVVHLVPYEVQKWFKNDLGLQFPYLPDVILGTSVAAYDSDRGLLNALKEALSDEFKQKREHNFKPPTEKATTRVAQELIKIARE